MKNLVIVESPTKAKTISRILGKEYLVTSSLGHIRDLPKSTMGIDIEKNFEPQYVIPPAKKKVVTELKKMSANAHEIFFATDEDREGEAISWHLAQVLKINPEHAKRITFHEITERAIQDALKHPRLLNFHLIDAQQARRILDRLVGYELSPFLWKKVAKGLSAGRVQSVAVRLIVEREREITAFHSEEYWSIQALFAPHKNTEETFEANLFKKENETIDKMAIKTKESADALIADIQKSHVWRVQSLEQKEVRKNPAPPFTTSTLQQEANKKLGFSAKQTMLLAQQLYEGIELGEQGHVGLITYMRTDSCNLSQDFLQEAKDFLTQNYGAAYTASSFRVYATKSKLAQEAHEAIRPTSVWRTPDELKTHLAERQYKLYKFIWQRAIATQMTDALLAHTTVLIQNETEKYLFKATGQVISFDGFLKISPHHTKENILPALMHDMELFMRQLDGAQHFTQPPSRYSEATLVKALEEYGIGRPSTYAPTIATIQDRNYVIKEEKKLKPTEMAFLVNDILQTHFPEIVDYQFTAKMEDGLDEVAQGAMPWQPMIAKFYHPFKEQLLKKYEELTKKQLTEAPTDQTCEKCSSPMVIKMGRYGKFLACSNYPECKNTKKLANEQNSASPSEPEAPMDEKCPQCEHPLQRRQSRFGPFIGCSNYPACKYIKNQQQTTGVACPKCQQGEIVMKKTRKGKIFYSCSRYPECDFALWDKPTGEICPKCQSLVIEKKDKTRCSRKECDWEQG